MVALFFDRKGQVVTPLELASHVQGRDDDTAKNAVEAMIARLRKKTESGAIETRRGFGYVLPDGPA
ncbi:Transcriptional activator protein CzcR [compost metagenome]